MEISNSDDVIDSRDVIARIAELEAELETAYESYVADCAKLEQEPVAFSQWVDSEYDDSELTALQALAEQGESCSDWRHGATLILDSHFEDYARQLADDLGLIKDDASWPATCIDWEQAARELRQDYSSVSFDGADYWVHSW